jgi:hypothetical protein
VVSEETGAVSYAYKGHLTRAVTSEELRAFLTSVFVNAARSRNWIARLRALRAERHNPGPVALAKNSLPETPAGK